MSQKQGAESNSWSSIVTGGEREEEGGYGRTKMEEEGGGVYHGNPVFGRRKEEEKGKREKEYRVGDVKEGEGKGGMKNEIEVDDVVLVLVDHQVGTISLVRDMDEVELKKRVLAVSRAATWVRAPVILTANDEEGPYGKLMEELESEVPHATFIPRFGEINAWEMPHFVRAVEAAGRKTLVMAGSLFNVSLAFTALSAASSGYKVFVIVDASGSSSKLTRKLAMERLSNAGVVCIDTLSFISSAMSTHSRKDVSLWWSLLGEIEPRHRTLVDAYKHENKEMWEQRYGLGDRYDELMYNQYFDRAHRLMDNMWQEHDRFTRERGRQFFASFRGEQSQGMESNVPSVRERRGESGNEERAGIEAKGRDDEEREKFFGNVGSVRTTRPSSTRTKMPEPYYPERRGDKEEEEEEEYPRRETYYDPDSPFTYMLPLGHAAKPLNYYRRRPHPTTMHSYRNEEETEEERLRERGRTGRGFASDQQVLEAKAFLDPDCDFFDQQGRPIPTHLMLPPGHRGGASSSQQQQQQQQQQSVAPPSSSLTPSGPSSSSHPSSSPISSIRPLSGSLPSSQSAQSSLPSRSPVPLPSQTSQTSQIPSSSASQTQKSGRIAHESSGHVQTPSSSVLPVTSRSTSSSTPPRLPTSDLPTQSPTTDDTPTQGLVNQAKLKLEKKKENVNVSSRSSQVPVRTKK